MKSVSILTLVKPKLWYFQGGRSENDLTLFQWGNCCCWSLSNRLKTSSLRLIAGCTSNCCHLGAFCVHHTTMHHVTSCKATYVAVTCHLHIWQHDRGLLRAIAVTRGWNGYRNKSTESGPWRRKFAPPLLQGFEPATFRSRIRRSNHWVIPAP